MKLTCKLNQVEALRSGFNPTPTVTLEVDLSAMTQEERETLASRLEQGGNDEQGYTYTGTIKEPTLSALMEDIHPIHAKLSKARAKAKIKQTIAIAKIRKYFRKRVTHTWPELVSAWTGADGGVQTRQGHHGDELTRGEAAYDFWAAGPHQIEPAQQGEWNRLMATAAGLKWIKEIQDENEYNRGIADDEAITRHVRWKKEHAEREAQDESLRQWAIESGSENLSLRAEEHLGWESLARLEWAVDAVRRAGITTPSLTEMKGYSMEADHVTDPTTEELKALQRVRQSMEAIPEADAEVELESIIYTEEDTMYPNVIKR